MSTLQRTSQRSLYRPTPNLDVLRIPLLGRLLRWRWGRLVFQLTLLLIAIWVIYDGWTGPQLAPANSATVLAWVHYRGLVILGLMLVGNLFCFACPFALPRTLARKLSVRGRRFPRLLRNKWVSIAGLFLIFWLYEWLDLWASPWLTAWLALAYFVGAFALEALFTESPFCKYVCPLGAFNFVHSTASPLQITARKASICQTCVGRECINGSETIPGCGTELFVPQINSNMDCTLCLDCARACPYDNVALTVRRPWSELLQSSWTPRWDLVILIVSIAFLGLTNAFGMVPPVYALQAWLDSAWGIRRESLQTLLVLVAGALLLPTVLTLATAELSRRLSSGAAQLRTIAAAYAPAFVPMSLGIWLAHYGFHLAIGGLSILPVTHAFLLDHGVTWFGGQPNWELSFLLPIEWIFPLQVLAVLGGFGLALFVLTRAALSRHSTPDQAFREMLPWALMVVGLAFMALSIFNLPMEMRGTFIGGNP